MAHSNLGPGPRRYEGPITLWMGPSVRTDTVVLGGASLSAPIKCHQVVCLVYAGGLSFQESYLKAM